MAAEHKINSILAHQVLHHGDNIVKDKRVPSLSQTPLLFAEKTSNS
jgi:hypothetical protein